jgi:hypothetical protein
MVLIHAEYDADNHQDFEALIRNIRAAVKK